MKIDRDTCEEIILTITRNKTRSVLTAFGVFWGIFMLVALIGGGQGMQEMMQKNFEGFATNSGFIGADKTSEAYKGFRKGRYWNLENKDIDLIKRKVKGFDNITATNATWGRTSYYQDKKFSGTVKGMYPEYEKIETVKLRYGRFINDMDVREERKVCVIGKRVYESLFTSGEDPTGKFIRIDGIYYQVIGVNILESNMGIQGQASESVCIPFSTMQKAYNMGNNIQIVCFTAQPGKKVKVIQDEMEAVVKEAHLIAPTDKQAVVKVNAEAMFSMVDNLYTGIKILSWMVGLGTLLAGAIGVSNIMMVTVKERTTEIGIRRAIGARPKDILQQILAESMVLTSIAGMAGISFAVGILQLVEIAVDGASKGINFQVSFWTAAGTGVLLLTLGLLAGLAPAYRAMAVKPIEAIRDE